MSDSRHEPGTRADDPRRPEGAFEFDVSLLTGAGTDGASGGDADRDARDGDADGREAREAEWRRVFEHFDPRLRSYFAARVPDEDALDDLMARLWRRALRGLPELRYAAGAWNWLVRVGTNLTTDDWRRARVRQSRHDAWRRDELPTEPAVPAPALSGDADDDDGPAALVDAAAVRAALETFAPVDAAVLRLRLLEGLEHEDIAERLGLPSAAAARKRFSRARAVLQERLRGERVEDDEARRERRKVLQTPKTRAPDRDARNASNRRQGDDA